jgi:hypothetical protein
VLDRCRSDGDRDVLAAVPDDRRGAELRSVDRSLMSAFRASEIRSPFSATSAKSTVTEIPKTGRQQGAEFVAVRRERP